MQSVRENGDKMLDMLIQQPPASNVVDVSIYGYGDAHQPDEKCVEHEKSDSEAMDKYGYGEAVPDSDEVTKSSDKYGYGEAVPDSDKYGYGYEEAVPDSDKYGYGYEEAVPDSARKAKESDQQRMPRRSSMKGGNPMRRASMGTCRETIIEVNLLGKGPVQRRRSITFEETVDITRITPASTLADPKALWLQDTEYAFIETKILTLLDAANSDAANVDENGNIVINGKKIESRGLEQHLNPEMTQLTKQRAVASVIYEQHLQRQVGEDDTDTLANLYKFSAVRSQREAAHRAEQDAKEAEEYLMSTRKMFAHRRASM
jgi:hypothetical protein